jgi:hypothetical protein
MPNFLSNISRSKGDPKIIETGPSSKSSDDTLASGLAWFSFALGAVELFAPRRLTRALGMQGQERLVQAYGVREIAAGLMSNSPDKQIGLWSRLAGDGLDLLTLTTALRKDNPKRDNVMIAMLMVAGVSWLDMVGAQRLTVRHARNRGQRRSYDDRSGLPKRTA